MLASYTFNSTYKPHTQGCQQFPSLRLLEGGKFHPQQYVPVLVSEYNEIRLKYFQWGLVSPWTKASQKDEGKYFAPQSQLFHHPAFQLPIRRKRCLIPADGYYLENNQQGIAKELKVSLQENETFCFAGIYDEWKSPNGTVLNSFSIVTVPSSRALASVNLQMPLILPSNLEGLWLNPYTSLNKIHKIVQLPPRSGFHVHQVQELRLAERETWEYAA
ncbi:MAG: SOS response-associated peptidase family protein [Bacteroidota bacterium]